MRALLQKQNTIDNYIRTEMKRQHIPGLSFAIIRDGEAVQTQDYGLANVELNVAATPDTVYHLASISKTFTAVGIMLLVEEGKVELDDTIIQYLDGLPVAWESITVRHLLTHTSGLVHESKATDEEYWKDTTDQEVIRTSIGTPLLFSPGEKAAYSNLGYQLLGMLIRKVSGMPYDEFLKERIFKPLDMTATCVYSLAEVIPNRAAGYIWNDGILQNGAYIAPTVIALANGGLLSTVRDMAKWDAALSTNKLLKQSTLIQMWTPATLNDGTETIVVGSQYGLGWMVNNFRRHTFIGHRGVTPSGFTARYLRNIKGTLTVILFTNQWHSDPDAIAYRLADFYVLP